MNKADLKLDWCSYQAAKWAVEHWHYSKTMPVAKKHVSEFGNLINSSALLFSHGGQILIFPKCLD